MIQSFRVCEDLKKKDYPNGPDLRQLALIQLIHNLHLDTRSVHDLSNPARGKNWHLLKPSDHAIKMTVYGALPEQREIYK